MFVPSVFSNELLAEPARVDLELDYLWAPENVAIICFTSGIYVLFFRSIYT